MGSLVFPGVQLCASVSSGSAALLQGVHEFTAYTRGVLLIFQCDFPMKYLPGVTFIHLFALEDAAFYSSLVFTHRGQIFSLI